MSGGTSVGEQVGAVPNVVRYESRYDQALRVFLSRAFPDAPLKADPRFLRWRLGQSPHGDSLRHCFLAVAGEQVVGLMAGMRDRVIVRGEWRDCLWMMDWMVLPEYRAGHTALRLFQAVMQSAELLLVVGAGPKVMGFYKVYRWRQVHVADTVFAVLDPLRLWELADASEERPAMRPWRKRLMRLAAPACRMMQAIYGRWVSSGEETVEVSGSLPPDAAGLQDTLLPRLGVTTDRSAEVLRWKFTDRPYGRHFFVTLRQRGSGTILGYAAVKLMQRGAARWAEVVDYLAEPREGKPFRRLMGQVLGQARRLRLDFVRLRCSLPCHRAALRGPFWLVRNRPVIDDLLIYSRDTQLVESLSTSEWHLTTIVSDRTDHGADETGLSY